MDEEKGKSLLTLTHEYNQLVYLISQSGGELNDTIDEALMINDLNQKEKVDGYAIIMDRIDAEVKYWADQIKKFSDTKKTLTNLKTKLKDNLRFVMDGKESDELMGNNYRYKLSRTKSTISYDTNIISKNYKKTIVSTELDHEKIKDDLDLGIKIEGISEKENFAMRKYLVKKSLEKKD